MWDIVIVGGSISGLYAALLHSLRARRSRQDSRIAILAPHPAPPPPVSGAAQARGKRRAAASSGRLRTSEWNGVRIQEGAGVARVPRDERLLRLADYLGVEVRRVRPAPGVDYHDLGQAPASASFGALHDRLRSLPGPPPSTPFRDWAESAEALGEAGYREFVRRSGFSDFEDADARMAMQWYGFEDLRTDTAPEAGLLDWNELVFRLWSKVLDLGHVTWTRGRAQLLRPHREEFTSIQYSAAAAPPSGRRVAVPEVITGLRVILAVPASALRLLLGPHLGLADPVVEYWLMKNLRAQPFCRIYIVASPHDGPGNRWLHAALTTPAPRQMTVDGPLQKMSPVGPVAGGGAAWVYQVAYSDNGNAAQLLEALPFSSGRGEPRTFAQRRTALACPPALGTIQRLMSSALGDRRIVVRDAVGFYWTEGTHTWTAATAPPADSSASLLLALARIRRPLEGWDLSIVGEAVGPLQGWTEGALWSVESDMNK